MFRKKRTSSPGLSVQLILIFVITIVTTIIIAGISSYWSLQSELDHQARERVSSGVRVSQTLIGAEKERINNLANHAAQRPTLQRLIYENNQEALPNYLQTFISGVDLDFIVISNGLGIPIAANIPINLPLDITKSTSIGFYISKENNDKLGLTATQTIPGETNEDTAFVSVGIYLDDIFAMQLAAESGFEQSFLIANKQVASSLPGVPVDRKDIDQASYELGYINTIKLVLSHSE